MAKISILDTVSTGKQSNMIGTPSSPGLSPVKWDGTVKFGVCILENGDTYLKFLSGVTEWYGGLTIRTQYWPVHPVVGYNDFQVYWISGQDKNNYHVSGSNVIDFGECGTMEISGTSARWNESRSYGVSEGQDVTESQLTSNGWKKTLRLEDWPMQAASVTLYALAMVLSNMPTVVNDAITLDAYPLTITADDNPRLFNYYPWERRINNIWYSLNRQGPSSTDAGLFRMKSGKWEPVHNSPGNGGKANGLRYNNGWQKSPKSGTGAK